MYQSLPLDSLRNNSHIKNIIPHSIGNVVWYGATHIPEEVESKSTNLLFKVILASIVIILAWCFLIPVSVYLPIIITVFSGLYISTAIGKGRGADYILGENGFCIIQYKNYRHQIINIKTVLFDDVKYIFFGETRIYENEKYNRTEYTCSFYGKLVDDSYPLLYSKSGSFIEDDCFKGMEHKFFSDYIFFKEIEDIWNTIFVNSHGLDETAEIKVVEYALHKNTIANKLLDSFIKAKGIASKSLSEKNLRTVTLTNDKLIIDGTEYSLNCLKYTGINKGFLIVEHENHKRKLLGLADKGDIHSIQLNGLSNMKSFIAMFRYRMGDM